MRDREVGFSPKVPGTPVRSRAPTRGENLRHQGPGNNDRKILLVDDNPDITEIFACLLRQLGYQVAVAWDGSQALRMVERFRPRFAIIAIGLPVMDGNALARQLRKLPCGKHLRLIALTGYGQRSDRQRSKRAGFDQHLVKPVDLAEVEAALAG